MGIIAATLFIKSLKEGSLFKDSLELRTESGGVDCKTKVDKNEV